MHYKHNQIFTDHDIPSAGEVDEFSFYVTQLSWDQVSEMVNLGPMPPSVPVVYPKPNRRPRRSPKLDDPK
jgi:hypothetical protein